MRRIAFVLFSFALGCAFGAGGTWLYLTPPSIYKGVARVIDGDNIEINNGWSKVNVRLVGINADELPHKCRRNNTLPGCTERAFDALKARLEQQIVSCTRVGFERLYNRPLGICHHKGDEVNMWLIRKCLAGSPPKCKHRIDRYESEMCPNRKLKPCGRRRKTT